MQLGDGSELGWSLPLADVKLEPCHAQGTTADHNYSQHFDQQGSRQVERGCDEVESSAESMMGADHHTTGYGPTYKFGLASALRVRFGDLDQVELGELIGRGGYGRVYRARWRGAPAAVKVGRCDAF